MIIYLVAAYMYIRIGIPLFLSSNLYMFCSAAQVSLFDSTRQAWSLLYYITLASIQLKNSVSPQSS